MVISQNLLAMNARRQFGITTDKKKKSTEKLSSGYRINRSADDAAGLSISEKMRWQIRGLDQGSRNTQDGISLLQVADGALSEVHDMLHRMNELSIQAANGTNTDEDRASIQHEIDQIVSEIDRISDTTEFNTRKLFKGNNQGKEKERKIIGYKTETISKTEITNKTDSFSFSVSGTSTDNSAKSYTVDALSNQGGLKIGDDLVSWSSIKDSSDSPVNLSESISAGTYSFDYKGLTISFDTTRDTTKEEFKSGLDGLRFNTKEEVNSALSYSLTVKTGKTITNDIQTCTINATQEGIYVDDVLYSWPDTFTGNPDANKIYSFSAGDVEFWLKTGENNTASFSDIIDNIGSKKLYMSPQTEYATLTYNMSVSASTSALYEKTGTEIAEILDNDGARIYADSYGMWLKLGNNTYEKKFWSDLGIDEENGTENKEYVYSDRGITFKFTAKEGVSIDDLVYALNDRSLNFSYYYPGTYHDTRLNTLAEYYELGPYYTSYYSEEEVRYAQLLQNFSFQPQSARTPTYEPDSYSQTFDDPGQARGYNESMNSVKWGLQFAKGTSSLLVSDNAYTAGNIQEVFVLMNSDSLRSYFNQRSTLVNDPDVDSGSVNLTFLGDKGTTIKVKLVDSLETEQISLDDFINAFTCREKYFNQNLVALTFPNNGYNVTYDYGLKLPYHSVGKQQHYTQYYGKIKDVNETSSSIIADSILKTPQYTYSVEETKEEEVQIPIYAEDDEEDDDDDPAEDEKYKSGSFWIQSGARKDDGMFITIDTMDTQMLGIRDLNVTTESDANEAIDKLSRAVDKISSLRGRIGAQQNRLEHTYQNTTNIGENTQAAESRIRDTDMSKEMIAFSALNILEQMGTSMTTQANQTYQGVLMLLK